MAKRFTDSEKYKKPFHRGLQGAYKLLWDFICHDCDHAGIWHIDFEIAQIYIGSDMPVNETDALKYFNEGEKRIEILPGGKWFIRPFIEFQYGTLNPDNRVHLSILNILKKNKIKPLISPLLGVKDKDKDKDKEKDKAKFNDFWEVYPKKKSKGQAETTWNKLSPDNDLLTLILTALETARKSEDWLKENGKYIPYPSSWLNAKGWEDEVIEAKDYEIIVDGESIFMTETEWKQWKAKNG
jgi:hypothetical protein